MTKQKMEYINHNDFITKYLGYEITIGPTIENDERLSSFELDWRKDEDLFFFSIYDVSGNLEIDDVICDDSALPLDDAISTAKDYIAHYWALCHKVTDIDSIGHSKTKNRLIDAFKEIRDARDNEWKKT